MFCNLIQGINEEHEDDINEDQRCIVYMEKRICRPRLPVVRKLFRWTGEKTISSGRNKRVLTGSICIDGFWDIADGTARVACLLIMLFDTFDTLLRKNIYGLKKRILT